MVWKINWFKTFLVILAISVVVDVVVNVVVDIVVDVVVEVAIDVVDIVDLREHLVSQYCWWLQLLLDLTTTTTVSLSGVGGLAVATISNLNLMFRLSWCWVGFWRFLEGLSIVITMSKHWLYPYSTPPYLCNHWHTKHRRGDHQLPHQLPFTLITQVATLTLAHWIAQVDYAAKFAAVKSASSWLSGSTESLTDSCLFPCSIPLVAFSRLTYFFPRAFLFTHFGGF